MNHNFETTSHIESGSSANNTHLITV